MVKLTKDDYSLEWLMETLNRCQNLTPELKEKYTIFYNLAREVHIGRIVELGTHYGLGAISLYYGARSHNGLVQVHTFDWYQDCIGVSGTAYSSKDLEIYDKNIELAGIKDIIGRISPFSIAAREWRYPIELLVWDGDVLKPDEDILEWERFIVPGGAILFWDTPDGKCRTHDSLWSLFSSAWYVSTEYDQVIRRKKSGLHKEVR